MVLASILLQSPAFAAPACIDARRTGSMVVEDLHGLFTAELLPLAIGLGAAGLVHPLDDNANRWVDARPPSHITRAGRMVGSWQVQGPLLGALVLDSLVEGCVRPASNDLIRAVAINEGVTYAIKFATRRERPNQESAHRSFPSGHASSTFALATVVQEHFGWRAGVAAYGVATYTAWSRVRDDKHWISDTVFGGALGVAVGRAVVRTRRSGSWSVVPTASRDGAAIRLVRGG